MVSIHNRLAERSVSRYLFAVEVPVPEWIAQLARISLFPSQPIDVRGTFSGWWEDVVGVPAESENRQPRAGTVDLIGPFKEGGLTLHVEPVRLDWVWTGTIDPALASPFEQASLGTADGVASSFFSSLEKWLSGFQECSRLAFGLVMSQPVGSREEGYRRAESLLNGWVHLDPLKSFDFSFQINLPTQSTVFPEHRINRLSRWSVGGYQSFQARIDVTPGVAAMSREVSSTAPRYFLRQELDVNTQPEPLLAAAGDKLRDGVAELRRQALAFISEGMPQHGS